jgi:group I intron endonuclease
MVHGAKTKVGSSYLYNSAIKHGVNNFTFEVLAVFNSRADLVKAEVDLIAKYKADKVPVYNLTAGGDGSLGYKHTLESKAKMADAVRARVNVKRQGYLYGFNVRQHYPPILIASYSNYKEAHIATGISKGQYYRLKRANPQLDWSVNKGKSLCPKLLYKFKRLFKNI